MTQQSIWMVLLLTAVPAHAMGEEGWSGGPGGMGDRPHARHGGGPGPHHPPGLAGREGFELCAQSLGITLTEGRRPELSSEQRTQLTACLEAKEAAVRSCLSNAGVTLPEPPRPGEHPVSSRRPAPPDETTRAKIDACRSQVNGSSASGATETSTDTSTSTSSNAI